MTGRSEHSPHRVQTAPTHSNAHNRAFAYANDPWYTSNKSHNRRMRPVNHQFAPFLRQRRADLGLSLQQLADRLDMAKSSLHQWEAGTNLPGATRLPSVAEALELPYEDFLAASGFVAPTGLPAFSPYLRARYRHLPDAAREEAEHLFEQLESKYGGPDGDGAG